MSQFLITNVLIFMTLQNLAVPLKRSEKIRKNCQLTLFNMLLIIM